MNILYYIIEANAYMTVLYMAYQILLKNSRFHGLNRYYLLLGSILSFIIPLFNFSYRQMPLGFKSWEGRNAVIHWVSAIPPRSFYSDLLLLVYVLGVITMILVLIHKLYTLRRMSLEGKRTTYEGLRLIYIDGFIQPFSFFKSVFLPLNCSIDANSIVIQHESVHVRERHSLDMILFEIMKIFSWFMPTTYMVQRELKLIHEYIVDGQIAGKGVDLDSYISSMLHNAGPNRYHSLSSGMNCKSLLANRILMMYNNTGKPTGKWKYSLPFILVIMSIWASSFFYSKDYGFSINMTGMKSHIHPASAINNFSVNDLDEQSVQSEQDIQYILPDTSGKRKKKKDRQIHSYPVIVDTTKADTVRDKKGNVMIKQNLTIDTAHAQ